MSAVRAREAEFNCDAWSKIPASPSRDDIRLGGFVHDVYEAPITGAFDRAVDALLAYRIFAAQRMYARVCTSDRRVAVGATIVQRAVLGPLAIETAVRVIEVVRTIDRAFFAYATLQGHPERGVASFAVTPNGRHVEVRGAGVVACRQLAEHNWATNFTSHAACAHA